MKIALYFGSFNPIHVAHLIIANYVVNNTDYKRIWFVISPQNPLKASRDLLNEYARLNLVQLAVEDDLRFQTSDIEFHLPKPSYTIDTLSYLKNKYKNYEFSVIIGGDSFQNFEKWKNYNRIVENHKILVYNRAGFKTKQLYDNQVILDKAPLLDISASDIRKLISEGKSIRYMVPEKVREEIEKGRYYIKKYL